MGVAVRIVSCSVTTTTPNSIVDVVEGRTFGAAAILHRRANDAACIGDKVRNDKHPAVMQRLLCFERARNVGALRQQTRAQSRDIVSADYIGARCRYPNVTFNVENSVRRKLDAAIEIP